MLTFTTYKKSLVLFENKASGKKYKSKEGGFLGKRFFILQKLLEAKKNTFCGTTSRKSFKHAACKVYTLIS
jgi:hypothetical protein